MERPHSAETIREMHGDFNMTSKSGSLLGPCFGAALLLSAMLVFAAQPMLGKLVLPMFGGSPSVWNTCMVFFQAMLLAGYGYAHLLSRTLTPQRQRLAHLILLVLCGTVLPMSIPAGWQPSDTTATPLSLLGLLTLISGLPFFAVTTTAPLLQHWFGQSSHRAAREPYFLYAVSNVGSMFALLGYPFLIEPVLGLRVQSHCWAIGYAGLVLLIGTCAWLTRQPLVVEPDASVTKSTGISNRQRVVWVLLSLVPSSWLLSTTTRLTTDFAPIPVLWVLPLALYLLTFILVFAQRQLVSHEVMTRTFSFSLVLLVAALAGGEGWFTGGVINTAVFFFGTWFCHGELARRRPDAKDLTEFYLWMSVGGVLGGMLNSLLAPVMFSVLLEFPIAVAAAGLCVALSPAAGLWPRDRLHWGLTIVVVIGLITGTKMLPEYVDPDLVPIVLGFSGVALLMAITMKPKLLAVTAGAAIVWAQFHVWPTTSVLHRARSFFGVHRVEQDIDYPDPRTGRVLPKYRRLVHGTTQHGIQSVEAHRACEPLAYYHKTGPLGDVLLSEPQSAEHIGVIGLGTGAMACYSAPQRRFTFYEVDPLVAQLAQTPEYFSYLSHCGRDQFEIVLGDGRLQIAKADEQQFDMLLLDAFSSDAIPLHLVTREALALYLKKLKPHGLIAFHISNRFLDLSIVLADLAADARLAAVVRHDLPATDDEFDTWIAAGKADSTYVVLAPNSKSLDRLREKRGWRELKSLGKTRAWTDDYSNLLSIVR